MKRNILFYFSVSHLGGAETTFIEIIKNLSVRGYNCYLIVSNNNGPMLDILKDFIIESKEINIKSLNFIRTIKLYRDFVKKNNIDTVFNFGLKVEVFSRLFSKTFGVGSIVSNIRSVDDWRKWYHIALDKITKNQTDIWVSNSEEGKIVFSNREKISSNKIEVIYNMSIEIESNYISNHKSNTVKTIGVLSNIKQGKGFEDILEICNKKLIMNGNIKFLIGGKDLMNGEIHKLVSKFKLDNKIIFLGFITDKEKFFNEIDLFFLPSYWEGMPCSVIESLKYGVPVVTTNVGGIPEIIKNNHNGLLFSPGDIYGMSSGIETLLGDKHLYGYFVENGHNTIQEKFNNTVLLNKWINIIDKLPKRLNRKSI